MKGESYPEHTAQFFEPIVKWIRDFLSGQDQEFLLEIDLKYFNSSSSRILYTIFEMLEEALGDPELIMDSIKLDLYFLGKSIGEKYHKIRICFLVFILGISASALSLIVVLLMR